jgi:hypothetical protein
MVAQLEIEQPMVSDRPEVNAPSQRTIEIGKITLMLPIEVDPKPSD